MQIAQSSSNSLLKNNPFFFRSFRIDRCQFNCFRKSLDTRCRSSHVITVYWTLLKCCLLLRHQMTMINKTKSSRLLWRVADKQRSSEHGVIHDTNMAAIKAQVLVASWKFWLWNNEIEENFMVFRDIPSHKKLVVPESHAKINWTTPGVPHTANNKTWLREGLLCSGNSPRGYDSIGHSRWSRRTVKLSRGSRRCALCLYGASGPVSHVKSLGPCRNNGIALFHPTNMLASWELSLCPVENCMPSLGPVCSKCLPFSNAIHLSVHCMQLLDRGQVMLRLVGRFDLWQWRIDFQLVFESETFSNSKINCDRKCSSCQMPCVVLS